MTARRYAATGSSGPASTATAARTSRAPAPATTRSTRSTPSTGRFDHSYGSGAPDAGFYIGQCFPCNAEITDSEAAYNGIGYSGTNTGGNLSSTTRCGTTTASASCRTAATARSSPPEHETTIVGNLVYRNNNDEVTRRSTTARSVSSTASSSVAATTTCLRNRVHDHRIGGIAIVPNPDTTLWVSNRNRVEGNVVTKSGDRRPRVGSAATGIASSATPSRRRKPPTSSRRCRATGTPASRRPTVRHRAFLDAKKPPSIDYRRRRRHRRRSCRDEAPTTAKAQPANHIVVDVDIDAVQLPKLPARLR